MTVNTIHPRHLLELCQAGSIDIIDVRTPREFQEVHLQGARNIPLDQLDPQQIASWRTDSTRKLIVICRSGARGHQGCEKLVNAGLANVLNVEGGTLACVDAGLPVVRGAKVMSLERQTRIAAGAIAATGAALALAVDPLFALISLGVGCGLMFAGITDSCMMGLLLAKMPWNRRGPKAACSVPTQPA